MVQFEAEQVKEILDKSGEFVSEMQKIGGAI